MPRKPDPALEARILDAARKLWIKGGDEALSMRAVARAARTNTPAIYRRFPHRTDILRALVRRVQQELFEVLQTCQSMEEVGRRTFEFALAKQSEYVLITSGLLYRIDQSRPNVRYVQERGAEWLGGNPEDHARLLMAIWSTIHGTAMLLITKTVPKGMEEVMSSVLTATLKMLVQNRAALSVRS
jgi:AcrR family transcriptional regulator